MIQKYFAMKKLLLFSLSACFILYSCQRETTQTDNNQGKLFIIGGGKRPDHLLSRMIDEAGLRVTGYAIILPMASEEPDTAIFYGKKQFTNLGISKVEGIHFHNSERTDETLIDSLKHASLIYISGGDQNRFMQIAGGTAIEDAIWHAYRHGAVIAGTSAGAAVMSKKMITGNELRYPEYSATFRNIESENIELGKGLGFVTTAVIDQHFVKRSRHNRLISAVIEHPDLLGIGIDEATALLVTGDEAEVIGDSQVLVFKNPLGSKHFYQEKLGARQLKLDIYLPGDKFKMKN
jgi:cyanophycinase